MPSGVPVATVGIGQAKNAGLLALRILSPFYPEIREWVDRFKDQLSSEVLAKKLED